MSERGVFAVDRGLFEHPMFAREPFTEREAWAWLIGEAAYKPHRRRVGAFQVELTRGQLAASIRFLAEKWQWHRSKVERFLERLKIETMIGTSIETGITVISICNYDKYQRVSLPEETREETSKETPPRQRRDKVEDREDKETPSSLRSEGRVRSRGERIQPEWQPTESHYDEGAKLGLDRAQVDGQAEDMRLWARANEHRAVARKSDWNLTFTGWMRRNRNGTGPRQARSDQAAGSGSARGDPIMAGMGRIAQRIGEKGRAAGSGGQVPGGFDLAGGADADGADEGGDAQGDRWPREVHGKDAA